MSAVADAAPEIAVVRQKAAGSSFFAAMRIMPRAEREAMYAIYAFCRAVDDIADDGKGDRAERQKALDEWRDDIELLYAGGPARLAGFLAPTLARFHPRKEDFLTVIDGMAMDVAQDIRAPALATLDLYCDRVASAVGRLSIKVFGMDEEPGFRVAHHLGRALQLTNILRDIDEDATIGRLYLPRELLREAGVACSGDPPSIVSDPAIDRACRGVSALARQFYDHADKIMAARPRGRLRAPRLMSAVYAEILRRMEAESWAPPRHRVRIGKAQLLAILIRQGFRP